MPIITIEEVFDNIEQNNNAKYSQELVIYFEKGSPNFMSGLANTHKKIINSIFELKEEGDVLVANNKGVYRQFSFTNSVIGTAVNLLTTIFQYEKENQLWFHQLPLINLKPMQSIKFSILTEDISYLKDLYLIRFFYKDIYSNSYLQEHDFAIFKNPNFTAMNFEVNQQFNPE